MITKSSLSGNSPSKMIPLQVNVTISLSDVFKLSQKAKNFYREDHSKGWTVSEAKSAARSAVEEMIWDYVKSQK